jgi:gliding motility-associated-like protein
MKLLALVCICTLGTISFSQTDSRTEKSDECVFEMEDGFTPNGDNANDCLQPVYNCKYDSFKIKIYNRWGEVLYESDNMDDCWDGKFKDVAQPTGVFVWVADITLGEESITYTGNVTLIR